MLLCTSTSKSNCTWKTTVRLCWQDCFVAKFFPRYMAVFDNSSANAALDVCGEWWLLRDVNRTFRHDKGVMQFCSTNYIAIAVIAGCCRTEIYWFSEFSCVAIRWALFRNSGGRTQRAYHFGSLLFSWHPSERW